MGFFMADKSKYVKRFKEIYEKKTHKVLDDVVALHYFENLIGLVGAICDGKEIKKIKLKKQ